MCHKHKTWGELFVFPHKSLSFTSSYRRQIRTQIPSPMTTKSANGTWCHFHSLGQLTAVFYNCITNAFFTSYNVGVLLLRENIPLHASVSAINAENVLKNKNAKSCLKVSGFLGFVRGNKWPPIYIRTIFYTWKYLYKYFDWSATWL